MGQREVARKRDPGAGRLLVSPLELVYIMLLVSKR